MDQHKISRRTFFRTAGLFGLASALGGKSASSSAATVTLPFAHGERQLVQYPQNVPSSC